LQILFNRAEFRREDRLLKISARRYQPENKASLRFSATPFSHSVLAHLAHSAGLLSREPMAEMRDLKSGTPTCVRSLEERRERFTYGTPYLSQSSPAFGGTPRTLGSLLL
jgi:hypothetical protein